MRQYSGTINSFKLSHVADFMYKNLTLVDKLIYINNDSIRIIILIC